MTAVTKPHRGMLKVCVPLNASSGSTCKDRNCELDMKVVFCKLARLSCRHAERDPRMQNEPGSRVLPSVDSSDAERVSPQSKGFLVI